MQARLGRTLAAGDEEPGRQAVAVLSEGLWRDYYGANPAVVGRTIRLDDQSYRIVGVVPAAMRFPAGADLWRPRDAADQGHNAYILARLRQDVGLDRAQADMAQVVAAITGGRTNPGMAFVIEPLKDTTVRAASASWLLLLTAAAAVYAIGCLNVSNLILVRGARRRREVEIRRALGASHWQVVRWLTMDSVLLGGLGALLSFPAGYGTVAVLRALAPPDTPRLADVGLDPLFMVTSALLAIGALFVCGLLPAVRLARMDRESLGAGGAAGASSTGQMRLRRMFVVAEIAMAIVLLVGASLLLRSLNRLMHVETGFRTDRLLTVNLHLPVPKYAQDGPRLDFITRMLAQLRVVPGVQVASASSGSMLAGMGLVTAQRTLAQRITRDGADRTAAPEEANLRHVDPNYFRAMGMRVVAGRGFATTDRSGSPPVAVINEAMAGLYGRARDAVGRRVAYQRTAAGPAWLTIVGVVGDTRDIALTEPAQPSFFVPIGQDSDGFDAGGLTVLVRTVGDPLAAAAAIRARLGSVDADVAVGEVSTADEAVGRYLTAPRFRTLLVSAFGAIGLLLALLGAYAVTSSWVAQRMSEMAVRLALGATRAQIVHLVLGQAITLAGAGMLIGLAAAMAGARLLSSLLFGVAPLDPPTLIAVPLLVLVVVVAACCAPAFQAASTDPAQVLRG